MVRNEHLKALLTSGRGMREGGSREAGGDIALEGVSAVAFRVLLRYLYMQELPVTEDCGEGLAAGEMAKTADYLQAGEGYEHCVEQFKGGLRVGNVVELMVYAHDRCVEVLMEVALEFLKARIPSLQVSDCGLFRMCSVVRFRDRHLNHTLRN